MGRANNEAKLMTQKLTQIFKNLCMKKRCHSSKTDVTNRDIICNRYEEQRVNVAVKSFCNLPKKH